ncbi:MAG: alpha-N-arabinofuranosidase [Clostridiales bacterium]|nr:alpha-N-arabinofuranosidase [Clostridiales bacterium]
MSKQAKMIIHKEYKKGIIDPKLYGSFIEHLGRAVYTGIYEPNHPTADENGFRQDVLELVKALKVPAVRYPGGNFVSGYRWEDGTGDKKDRPVSADLAWHTIEPNEVGIDEFQDWAKKAETDIIMAVNLGTRGPEDARNLVEYCNGNIKTQYAEMRRKNGFDEPFSIKYWCLGNEMDGHWQICHKTASEYGRVALEAGKLMKMIDPNIELVICGSSNYNMDTFGTWEWTVLNEAYSVVDYISLHQYYSRSDCKSTEDFLGRASHMDSFIKGVAAICDAVQAKKHSKKKIHLSFDEWNVWDMSRWGGDAEADEPWREKTHILEQIYTFEDALLVGSMLSTLQNNCDRVKIACMAQLVNVIAPIMTEDGGKAWKQTIYYPYYFASVYGRGECLDAKVFCDIYRTSDGYNVPYVCASVVLAEEKDKIYIFASNLSLEEDTELTLCFEDFGEITPVSKTELYCEDLKAVNTKDCEAVSPTTVALSGRSDTSHTISLRKHSWNMFEFKLN